MSKTNNNKKEYKLGVGIAQLVEHSTEKPGIILTLVQVRSAGRDFSPTVIFQCRLSYDTVAYIYQHLFGLKIPNAGSHTID